MKEKEGKEAVHCGFFIDHWCLWIYDLVRYWTWVVALRSDMMVITGR